VNMFCISIFRYVFDSWFVFSGYFLKCVRRLVGVPWIYIYIYIYIYMAFVGYLIDNFWIYSWCVFG